MACVFNLGDVCFLKGGILLVTLAIVQTLALQLWIVPYNDICKLEDIAKKEWWSTVVIPLTSIFAAPLAGLLSWKLGRIITLVAVSVLAFVSCLMLALTDSYEVYVTALVFMGVSVGGAYLVLPVYLTETTRRNERSSLGASLNLYIVIGSVLPHMLLLFMSKLALLVTCGCVAAITAIFVGLQMPESPAYLFSVDKEQQAITNASSLLLSTRDVEDMRFISDVKMNRRGLVISCALFFFYRLSGVNAMDAIVDMRTVDEVAVVLGIKLVSCLVSVMVANRYPRRRLLLISAVLMLLSNLIISSTVTFGKNTLDESYALYVYLAVFSMGYNLGFGAFAWLLMAELLPDDPSRCVAGSFSWLCAFLIDGFFGKLGGGGKLLWMFPVSNLLALVFVFCAVPETNTKTLKEIREKLQS